MRKFDGNCAEYKGAEADIMFAKPDHDDSHVDFRGSYPCLCFLGACQCAQFDPMCQETDVIKR